MDSDPVKATQQQNLDEVLAEYMQRLDRGESVDREALIQAHPGLADDLRDFFQGSDGLKKYAYIDEATANFTPRATRRLRCPRCNAISLHHEGIVVTELTCDSCGSRFEKDECLEDAAEAPQEMPFALNRYRVLEELGRGGFGSVLLCDDPLARRKVAIKIPSSKLQHHGAREALLHEARVVAQLSHPHIVKLLDIIELADDRVGLVYEYVAGKTLKACLEEKDFELSEALSWCETIATALEYAHSRGVVHRDIKPANILLDAVRGPRLADFGLALHDEQSCSDEVGSIVGTVFYMSPEQAAGRSNWSSPQSDIYSLGAVLYELLSGRVPFRSDVASDLLEQIQHRPPIPPRAFDQSLPVQLENICLRALSKDPAARFATAGDMAAALRRHLNLRQGQRWWPTWILATSTAALLLVAAWAALSPIRSISDGEPTNASRESLEQAASLVIHVQRRNEQHGSSTLSEHSSPIEVGDKIVLQGMLPSEAFAYLVWFDSEAQPAHLWPRDLENQKRVRKIDSPTGEAAGGREVHVVTGNAGTQLVLLGVSERPLTATELTAIDDAAQKLHVTRLELTKLVQVTYPPPSDTGERAIGDTATAAMDMLPPEFAHVLRQHFSTYRVLLVPQR